METVALEEEDDERRWRKKEWNRDSFLGERGSWEGTEPVETMGWPMGVAREAERARMACRTGISGESLSRGRREMRKESIHTWGSRDRLGSSFAGASFDVLVGDSEFMPEVLSGE